MANMYGLLSSTGSATLAVHTGEMSGRANRGAVAALATCFRLSLDGPTRAGLSDCSTLEVVTFDCDEDEMVSGRCANCLTHI